MRCPALLSLLSRPRLRLGWFAPIARARAQSPAGVEVNPLGIPDRMTTPKLGVHLRSVAVPARRGDGWPGQASGNQFALAAWTSVVRTWCFTSASRPASSAPVRGPRTPQRFVS